MNQPPCQQKDIAKALGISQMTVSLALRHSPRISEATRKKVEKAAAEMGYQRNPFSTALRARREMGRRAAYKGCLAWLTNFPERDGWKQDWILEYHAGASEACRHLGYQLGTFWYREKGVSAERLSSMLGTRGITGILLPPQPEAHMRMDLNWESFSAVRFGYSLEWPPLNLVTNHQFDTVMQIVRRLAGKGYRRIGFAVPRIKDERVFLQAEGAFFAWQRTVPKRQHVAPYIPNIWSDDAFVAWVRKKTPDALVLWEPTPMETLRQNGILVPRDVGAAIIHTPFSPTGPSGIDQDNHALGYAAASQLVFMVERGERGIPTSPRHLLLSGRWNEGATAPGPTSRETGS